MNGGGGYGPVSQALALATTDIAFIVPDLAGTVSKGASLLPHAKRQSQFMKHDLFTEQVAKEANVYFFRWVFHNWNDKYCVRTGPAESNPNNEERRGSHALRVRLNEAPRNKSLREARPVYIPTSLRLLSLYDRSNHCHTLYPLLELQGSS